MTTVSHSVFLIPPIYLLQSMHTVGDTLEYTTRKKSFRDEVSQSHAQTESKNVRN